MALLPTQIQEEIMREVREPTNVFGDIKLIREVLGLSLGEAKGFVVDLRQHWPQ
jgi:ribosomal protein L7/L12